jgi:hypothetical protein
MPDNSGSMYSRWSVELKGDLCVITRDLAGGQTGGKFSAIGFGWMAWMSKISLAMAPYPDPVSIVLTHGVQCRGKPCRLL